MAKKPTTTVTASPMGRFQFRKGKDGVILEELHLCNEEGKPSWTEWKPVPVVDEDASIYGE